MTAQPRPARACPRPRAGPPTGPGARLAAGPGAGHGAAREAAQQGFTLIEVLVAFVIVIMAFSVVYRGMVDGVAASQVAIRAQQAISRAQSHLAAVGHGMRVGVLEQDGDDGSGFHWHVRILPEQTEQTALGGLGLYRVEVSESWPDPQTATGRRMLVLHTRRLGPAGEAP
ncbi:prepilin-type N-terminal cleavage/methylation domain-containing protein [Acetobacter sp. TBRC 12305]|uniref:Type II secretion system protein n=1 Tax=Acetobacter garciniae TaxID=2817435 RepID=A0A939HPU7_9PROT|nr:type II secretion system protein [Acetobacter garciniae]MBO1325126.1 type II secretion system protein [Acetobacter garciniae]MBX0344903.1 prepilin-type N-terminal cleavage/methylation domain-containing protein [Acetobacter garciniae]